MEKFEKAYPELKAQAQRMLESQKGNADPARFWARCESVLALCEEVTTLRIENARLREEIARYRDIIGTGDEVVCEVCFETFQQSDCVWMTDGWVCNDCKRGAR